MRRCDSNFTVRKFSGILHAIFFFRKFSVSIRFVHVTVISPFGISVESYMLYFLKFHSLIVFTSWDIAQYMHCNYLFHNLWRHKFWNLPDPLNQAVFLHDQKVKTKILIFWEGKELSRWNKNQFSSFLKGFQWSKIVSDFWVRFYPFN